MRAANFRIRPPASKTSTHAVAHAYIDGNDEPLLLFAEFKSHPTYIPAWGDFFFSDRRLRGGIPWCRRWSGCHTNLFLMVRFCCSIFLSPREAEKNIGYLSRLSGIDRSGSLFLSCPGYQLLYLILVISFSINERKPRGSLSGRSVGRTQQHAPINGTWIDRRSIDPNIQKGYAFLLLIDSLPIHQFAIPGIVTYPDKDFPYFSNAQST